jgi:hypothetical protein
MLLLVLASLPAVPSLTVGRAAYASFGISQGMGIDGCNLQNNLTAAKAFWDGTPYYNFGLYLGGSSAGCPTTSKSFVHALYDGTRGMYWQLLLIWVGRQAPCNTNPRNTKISTNTTDAYEQGKDEAIGVYNKLLEFDLNPPNTPVVVDIEAFDTTNTTCLNAVKAFTRGWVFQMHLPPAQKAGVYGSTCASGLSALAGVSPRPDYITGAAWDGVKSTSTMPCISSSSWTNHQRHKQYRGDHSETWNGVKATVDSDCSNGPVYPGPDVINQGQGCV